MGSPTLVRLTQAQLNTIAPIQEDGSIGVNSEALSRLIAKHLGVVGIRTGVGAVDYCQRDDGTPEPATRSLSGIWWHPQVADTALIGGFIIDGLAMTISTEGEGESPFAEDQDILQRATSAIASQYPSSEVARPGVLRLKTVAGVKTARVVVTRDHRIRRPEDLLSPEELSEFRVGKMGLAIMQMIGGGKALVVKHGI